MHTHKQKKVNMLLELDLSWIIIYDLEMNP